MVILLHQLRADVSENDIRCLYLFERGGFDGGVMELASGSDFFYICLVIISESTSFSTISLIVTVVCFIEIRS